MRVSMHPYPERTPDNPAFYAADDDNPCRRAHERLLGLAAEVARMQGAETVVNIHPAAAETRKAAEAAGRHAAGQAEDVRRWLVEQSVRFFAWARGWCEANGPRVRVVAELQIGPGADEPLTRIGDDYDELAEIVGRSGVPACWDFGHAVMNARRLGRPLDPPAELLSAVAHVHCHDVGRSDHQPLVHGTVPWQRFLERLVSAGFDGTVILEVPAEHFSAAGGLAVLERSVTALRQEIDRLRSRGTAV
jgi:sugar phosphate isomerase/epimerase